MIRLRKQRPRLENRARELAANPELIAAEYSALMARLDEFRDFIEAVWGEDDAQESGPTDYVKYTDQYYSRAHIDFEAGTVTVETVAPDSQQNRLKQAIVTTLLTPDDPRSVDLYSDTAPEPAEGIRPFLYEQVLDQDGEAIEWEWRAERYADYLIDNKLTKIKIGA